jgi:GTP-binding protein HflX
LYINEVNSAPESAILVGVILPRHSRWEVRDNISELRSLADTSGVMVVDELIQERQFIDPAYFIGTGKVEELSRRVKMHHLSTVIFDDDLSPAQARNLEKATGAKIVDRSALILDIFAQHARTREARTQVELAQLQYLLPRLTRQWTHLSRQVGGIGTKGPGETQLETDRRLIRKRIETLQKELQKIDQQRQIRRKGRSNIFRASLVGYTNVGKSTIMNLLSGSDVLVENQLFATLDSTVRRAELDLNHDILLSDTVGFIRKLPHNLIASFKSTLDEAVEADILLHVVDVSHPAFSEQIHVVNEVLQEIGAGEKPVLIIFNKIDLLEEKTMLQSLKQQYPNSVFISATRHIRIKQLNQELINFIEKNFVDSKVQIPLAHSRLVNTVYSLAVVTHQEYSDSHVTLQFRSSADNRSKIKRLLEKAVQPNRKSVEAD